MGVFDGMEVSWWWYGCIDIAWRGRDGCLEVFKNSVLTAR